MDIVIMAGGKGSRLGGVKKPFLEVCGKRLIDVVLDAALDFAKSVDADVYICLRGEDRSKIKREDMVHIVECPGLGYIEDLNFIFQRVSFPVLVLPADMPFITVDVLKKFLFMALQSSADVVTLMACKNSFCRETGVSLFRRSSGLWENIYFEDSKELRDIDTFDDFVWVQSLCASMGETEKRGWTSVLI